MTTLSRLSRARTVGAALLASAAAFAVPTAASAAPLSYTVPSTGANITLSVEKIAGGLAEAQRITFTGTGFKGTNPAGGDLPVVAIKLDQSDFASDWGGLDAGGLPDESDSAQFHLAGEPDVAGFPTKADGSVSGWFDIRPNLAQVGPGEGDFAGQHWFNILSGAFSTNGDITSGTRNVTEPISGRIYFTAVDPLTVGFTNANSVFFPGSTVPAAPGALTVKGIAFPANTAVTVTLDGAPVAAKNYGTAVDLTTSAAGDFNAGITLTPGAPGVKTLQFTAGAITRTVTITRVAQTAAHVTSQTVRPGGTVAVRGTGYVGISGAGQKVGLILQPGDKLLGCGQADASGAVTVSGVVPADETPGAKSLFVAAGANCVTGGPVVDPMPRLTQLTAGTGLTVSATAPVATTAFKLGSVGGTLPIAAEGFAAGESVAVKLDGTTVGTPLVAGTDGKISGNVTIPAATALGDHVVTLVSNAATTPTGVVAVGFKAVAAAKVTLTSSATVEAGQKVTFSLAGFQRGDATAGQKVGVKVDAGAIVECVVADVEGNGTGSITIPADTSAGEHTLRFLAGSSCVSGAQNDLPSRSLASTIQVTVTPQATPVPAPTPAPTPAPVPTPVPTPTPTLVLPSAPKATKIKSTAKGASIELTLATGAGTSVKVGAKTKSKIKLTSKAKAKIVTVVSAKTVKATKGKTPKVTLKLTADGRKLLKARRSLKIVVTIQVSGSVPTTKTFTLKA